MPDPGTGLVSKYAPVGAELVAHRDPGHDAHAEGEGEDLFPEVKDGKEDRPVRGEPKSLEHGQITGKPDRESGEHDVKGHGEGKLKSRQSERVEVLHEVCLRLSHGPALGPLGRGPSGTVYALALRARDDSGSKLASAARDLGSDSRPGSSGARGDTKMLGSTVLG